MKLLVLTLAVVVSMAMAGLPPRMEDIFREIMASDESNGGMSGGGGYSGSDDHKDSGDTSGGMSGGMSGMMNGDWGDVLNMFMQGNWRMDDGDDHTDSSSDSNDSDYKGSDERGWYNAGGDSSNEHDSGEDEDYMKFKKWMEERRKMEEHDEKEEKMRKKIMDFKEYREHKQNKEHEMEERKKALYKQMKMIQEKKMMSQHLQNITMELMMRRRAFTFEVVSRFLEFCDCQDSMDLFKRIKEGRFGHDDDDNDSDETGDQDIGGGDNNGGDAGHSDDNGGMEFHKPSDEELMEIVMRFLYMNDRDRMRYVMGDLVKVMCGAAKQFFAHIRQVEYYLMQYRRHMYGGGHH